MIRRAAQTVRGPVARMAPTARVWALAQTQGENSGAKAASMATISGGRSTGVVSRIGGSCTTVDHGQRPPYLPANLGGRRRWTPVRPGQSRGSMRGEDVAGSMGPADGIVTERSGAF